MRWSYLRRSSCSDGMVRMGSQPDRPKWVASGHFACHVGGVLNGLTIIGIIAALCVGALVIDYGCYYQATIFTTLDGSGKGMDEKYRDPPYHPFVHPVLWILMVMFIVPWFFLLAFNIGDELSALVSAVAGGGFFAARYILMRRGIS